MKLRLTFKSGHHRGQVLEFDPPRTLVLGRSSQADVQIYDERISRRHCAIRFEPASTRIKDLGSGNGTFVNGAEIRETVLAAGDVVALGRTELEVAFVAPEPPGRAAPPVAPTGGPARPDARASGRQASGATCTFCGAFIPPEQLHLVAEHRGRYLCTRCSPQIQIPGYRLDRRLGEGAMGVVYLAIQEARNLPVALKVLKSRGELTDEDRARFVREVQTSAQLQHPNIVRVLDQGQAPPHLYYVMEYVPGRSLVEWIKAHGKLPLPSALRVAVQVAAALEHARTRHIVHRDIKPENIIVQGDGHAKLADFGLAKNIMTSGASGLTRPGDGLGTLPYMPPEQIENALYADHRSDIYSYGATIYHMLTGRSPFVARTPLEFFTKIRSENPPPITEFRQDIPQVVIAMVEKAMAKDPADRYQTVHDMYQVMNQFLKSEFDSRQTAS